jgi:hypothetical protein
MNEAEAILELRRITGLLNQSATYIEQKTRLLADTNYELAALKDKIEEAEALVFSRVVSMTDENGKTKYSSDKGRDMATTAQLTTFGNYTEDRLVYRAKLAEVEKLKAEVTRLHEQRRDLNSEIELLKPILAVIER